MKLFGLVLLSVILSLIINSSDAFAGGPEYDNRANAFWLQFYVAVIAIAGIMVTIGVLSYKIVKRKAMSKNTKKEM